MDPCRLITGLEKFSIVLAHLKPQLRLKYNFSQVPNFHSGKEMNKVS